MNTQELAQELLDTMATVKVSPDNQNPTNELLSTDYFVLEYLTNHTDVNPGDLSKAFNVTAARMTVVIKRLEKKSFITVIPHPNDLRKRMINLSENGRQYLKQANEKRLNFVIDMLDYLGEADSQAYIRILKKLAQRE